MLAGTLEIQIAADVARIKADMGKATGHVTHGVKQMQQSLDSLRASLSGLFAGASMAGFTMWIKSAIDFQDQLNDLNKTTNITVSRLAGISLMSKQTGSDLTGMAQAMNKLTMEMGKAPEKFAKIGITAKDPLEAFKQLSEIFRSIEDPQLRAAVAAEALGKGWAAAAPALAEGAAAIDQMVKRGEDLAGITQRDAEMADAFNDALSELQLAIMGTASNLAGDMLPLLTELVKQLTETTDEINKTESGFNLLTEGLRLIVVAGRGAAFVFKEIGIEIGVFMAQAAAIWTEGFAGIDRAREIGKMADADYEKRVQAFVDGQKRLMDAGKAARQVAADFRESERAFAASNRAISAGGLRAFVGGDDGAKAANAYRTLINSIQEKIDASKAELAASRQLTEAEKFELKVQADLKDGKLKLIPAQKAAVQQLLAEVKAAELKVLIQRSELELAKQLAATRQQQKNADYEQSAAGLREITEANAARLRSVKENIQSMRDEAEAIILAQKSNISLAEAIELVAIARLKEKQERMVEGGEAWLDVQKEIDARKELLGLVKDKSEYEKLRGVWESIDKTAHDVFVNIFEGGSNVFKKLGQTLKAAVLDLLYQMTIKKWIVSIGTSMSLPGAAAQSLGGGGGGIGSILGSLGGSDLLGSIGSAVGGAFGAFGAGGSALAAGGAGSLGMLGPLGLAAAAIYFLSQKFKGETRVGGQYSGTSLVDSPSGGAIGGASDAIGATITSINQTLKALGSGSQLTQLVSGLEQSERGKGFAYAGGILSSGAVFGQGYGGGGHENRRGNMTSEQALAAFGEELKQATLQALQAADVPGQLGDYLRSLGDIDALSGGALDAALARINKALAEKTALEDRYFMLTTTEAEQLARAREREMAAIDESNHALLQSIYAREDEIRAAEEAAAAQALAAEEMARAAEEAAEAIQKAADRLASLQQRAGALAGDFLSPGEMQGYLATKIQKRLEQSGIGFSIDQIISGTRDQLKELFFYFQSIGALDQQEAILDVADAFLQLHPAAETAADSMADLQRRLMDLGKGVFEYVRDLRATRAGTASPLDLLTGTRTNYLQDLALARMNNVDAMGRIQGSAQAYIEAAKGYGASGTSTQAVINQVIAELSALPAVRSYEQQMLELLGEIGASTDATSAILGATAQASLDRLQNILGEVQVTSLATANILRRLSEDSILSYSRADVASVYLAIRDNTQRTADILAGMGAVGSIPTSTGGAGAGTTTGGTTTGGGDSTTDAQRFSQELALYEQMKASGQSIYAAAAGYGWDAGTVDAWLARTGLPSFAVGTNRVPSDMLAMVHRDEAIVPARYNPAAGGSNADPALIAEVRALRDQVAALTNTTVAANGQKLALQRETADGVTRIAEQATRPAPAAPRGIVTA